MEQLHQVADAPSALNLPEQLAPVSQSAPQAATATGAASAQSPVITSNQAAPAAFPAAAGQSSQPAQGSSAPQGMSLVAAVASISTGRSMITDMVFGSDNQVTQIRVIDPATHRVIAATPPDTIARFEREVAAYQQVARDAGKNS